MKRLFTLLTAILVLCSALSAQDYFTVIILSDPHLNHTGHDGTSPANMSAYIQNIINMGKVGGKRVSFSKVPSLVPTADLVLCLGDMDQDSMDDHATFEGVFDAFTQAGIPFLTMAGNHDYVPDYWDNGTEVALTGGDGGIADNEATKATVNRYKEAAALLGVEDITTIVDGSDHRQGDPYTFRFRGIRFYCGQEYWFYKPYGVKKIPLTNIVTGYDKYYAADGVISALETFVEQHCSEPSVWTQHFPLVAGSDNERWWLDNNNTGNHIDPSNGTAYSTAEQKKQKYASLMKQTVNPVHFSGHTHSWATNTYDGIKDYTVAAPGRDAGAAYAVLCQEGVGVVEVQQVRFNTNTPTLDPTAGYLYNIASKGYLSAGADWGTQGLTDEVGTPLNILYSGLGRTIETGIYNSATDHFLGGPNALYMDQPAQVWQFLPITTNGNTYRLTTDGENYLCANTTTGLLEMTTKTTAQNTKWRIDSREDRITVLASAMAARPRDATFLIACPDFGRNDSRFSAWQGEPVQGGLYTNMCAEKYNTSFDVFQELTGIPNGSYKLTCQGFYRAGIDGTATINGVSNPRLALLYANDAATPLMNIFQEQLLQYPDNMDEAAEVFSEGLYADNELIVYVTDASLRIGIRKTDEVENDWTIFDRFRLSYLGTKDYTGIQTLSSTVPLQEGGWYDLSGRSISAPRQSGVYIRDGKKVVIR